MTSLDTLTCDLEVARIKIDRLQRRREGDKAVLAQAFNALSQAGDHPDDRKRFIINQAIEAITTHIVKP